jgi:two-component system response regulator ChvI
MQTLNARRDAETPLIYLVDDDPLFRESLSGNLLSSGFAVEEFGDGADFLDRPARGRGGDLMLLDWKMPRVNGIEVLRRLREAGDDIPVIFLTVLSDQFYEEAALHGGAVDFVEKSRSFSILLKRIELTLGRADQPRGADAEGDEPAGDIEEGPLLLAVGTRRVRWTGIEVPLSLTEFRIVHAMASRAGTDISYREIYDVVHGRGFVAGHGPDGYRSNVRTSIKRIRQKFRDIDEGFDEIENYPGFCYRWRTGGGED